MSATVDVLAPMVEVFYPPSPLSHEDANFVVMCVQVLIRSLELSGFDSEGARFRGTTKHWIYCAAVVGDVVKFVKYKLAAYFACNMSSPSSPLDAVPVPSKGIVGIDSPGLLFGGKAYKFLQMKKVSDKRWWIEWCTTVLYSKGGMPRPSDLYVSQAEMKAFTNLTTETRNDDPEVILSWADESCLPECLMEQTVVSRATFTKQLSRTVQELFSGKLYTDEHRYAPFLPSTSANYINSRSGGGAVGHLISDRAELMSRVRDVEKGVRGLGVHRLVPPYSRRGAMSMASPVTVVDPTVMKKRFRTFMSEVTSAALEEDPVAIPLGLKESLKVRVISKGPPMLYTALKPLQKFMWSTLRREKPFELIGRPVDEWYVQKVLGGKLRKDQSFLSVDYSDATNQMKLWASDVMIDQVADVLGLSDIERKLMHKGLTGHTMRLKQKFKGKMMTLEAIQKKGQLMGSVISFPFLCIINSCILRWTKELDDKRVYSLADAGIMVNGDDGCLRTTPLGMRIWSQLANFIGLVPSIGKVYFSRDFMNINSTNFTYDPEGRWVEFEDPVRGKVWRQLHFHRTPFIRMSLFEGQKRSAGASQSGAPLSSLGAQCRELIAGCPEHTRERVLCGWMSKHRERLESVSVPYFIPEELGGMGLPIVKSDKRVLQPNQLFLRVARKIHDHPGLFPSPRQPTLTEWQMWNLAQKLGRSIEGDGTSLRPLLDYETITRSEAANYGQSSSLRRVTSSSINALLVVEVFLTAGRFEELFKALEGSVAEKIVLQYYRNWSRLYQVALKDQSVPLPEPYNVEKFPSHLSLDKRLTPFLLSGPSGLEPGSVSLESEYVLETEDPWSLLAFSSRNVFGNNEW